jgi:hypothetical protein
LPPLSFLGILPELVTGDDPYVEFKLLLRPAGLRFGSSTFEISFRGELGALFGFCLTLIGGEDESGANSFNTENLRVVGPTLMTLIGGELDGCAFVKLLFGKGMPG